MIDQIIISQIVQYCEEPDVYELYQAMPKYRAPIMKSQTFYEAGIGNHPFKSGIYIYPDAPDDAKYLSIPEHIIPNYDRFYQLEHIELLTLLAIPENIRLLTIGYTYIHDEWEVENGELRDWLEYGNEPPSKVFPNIDKLIICGNARLTNVVAMFPNVKFLSVGKLLGQSVNHNFISIEYQEKYMEVSANYISENKMGFANPYVEIDKFINFQHFLTLPKNIQSIMVNLPSNVINLDGYKYWQIDSYAAGNIHIENVPRILIIVPSMLRRIIIVSDNWKQCRVFIGCIHKDWEPPKRMDILIHHKTPQNIRLPKYVKYLTLFSDAAGTIISQKTNCYIYKGEGITDNNIRAYKKLLYYSNSIFSPVYLLLSGLSRCSMKNVEYLALVNTPIPNGEITNSSLAENKKIKEICLIDMSCSGRLFLPALDKLVIFRCQIGEIYSPHVRVLISDFGGINSFRGEYDEWRAPNYGTLFDFLDIQEVDFR